MDNRPIGIFDSGLGGLTVLKEIMEMMPGESMVYFGDSGRTPYGTKSKETVIKYTLQNIRFLMNQDIKMIVIACNTASAYSLEMVKNNFKIPIIEVIQPGAATGIKSTKNKKIGVIGTNATINSGAYEKAINKIDNSIQVFSKACPLFVPLVEEGPEWWENDITYRIAIEYLSPLKLAGIDTLVLGCTHYPLLQNIISKVMGSEVKLVSSALEVARAVKNLIEENNIARDQNIGSVYRYYTSDSVDKFEPLCSAILNQKITCAERADIEKY
ncbi:MAG TPA: glutamate racemase [Clostridiaceae bacterium]|jgi:glutamate racemase|nr:glutamate racemase [Clostridiaceae bacterium]